MQSWLPVAKISGESVKFSTEAEKLRNGASQEYQKTESKVLECSAISNLGIYGAEKRFELSSSTNEVSGYGGSISPSVLL